MKRTAAIILMLTMLTSAAFAGVTPALTDALKADFLASLIATYTMRIALFVQANSTLSRTTTAYTGTVGVTPMTGEVTPFATYSAGGKVLNNCAVSSTAAPQIKLTCDSPQWLNSTITADSAMVYLIDYPTAGTNRTAGVYTFTSATSSGNTFTITLPSNLLYLE